MRMNRKILLGSLLLLVFIACFMIIASDESDASLTLDPNGADTSSGGGTYTNTGTSGTYTLPSDPYLRANRNNYIYINDGYTFLGWANSPDATQPDYPDGYRYPLTSSADTVYAVWTSVTFDPNGGSIARDDTTVSQVLGPTDQFTDAPGSQFTVTTYTYRYNRGWIETPTDTTYTFSRTGYTFLGWADSPSATVPDYEQGDSFGSKVGSFTVYAVWQSIYNITFDANGGTVYDGSSTSSSTVITAEVLTTAPGPGFNAEGKTYLFSRDGYILMGWSESSTSVNPEYTYGTAIPTTRNATLYAIWSAGITFDPNGGTVTCSDGSASPYAVSTGSITIPSSSIESAGLTYKYTRSGYMLSGWATSSSATSPDYVVGDSATINVGCTLYAVWSAAVIFDPNGGSVKVGNVDVDPYMASLDAPVYVPSNAFTLVNVNYSYIYQGHTFLGWATSPTATQAEYTEGNILPTSTTGYSLYAVWVENEYNLVLHYSDDYELTIRVMYKEKVDLTSYMAYNTGMNGYKIVGWCVNPMDLSVKDDGAYLMPSGKRYNQNYTLEVMSDDIIYPIWAKICTASNSGSLTISGSGCYYITCPIDEDTGECIPVTGYSITVAANKTPHIFTGNLDITASSTAAMTINTGASVELTVVSDSSFTGASTGYNGTVTNNRRIGYAGINVKTGATLTVSSYSTGTLTAQGGDAFSSYNNRTAIDAYSGAGIGTNGYESTCGTIIIEGGTVYARGGSAIVNMNSRYNGSYNYNGLNSGAGIGGNGATIEITGGTVTASTGSIFGMYRDGMSDTNTYTNSSSGTPWGTASEPLNPTTEQGTVIGDGATVYLYGRSGGTMIVDDPITLVIYARNGGSITPVGSAASIDIEGYTINLGGSQIPVEGLTIQIDAEIVKDEDGNLLNSIDAILITALKNYFSGTGTLNLSTRTYTIYVDENNALPHGLLTIYGKNGASNPTEATGNEAFGTITPSAPVTLGGTSMATYDERTLTLDLAEGYMYVNVLYKSGDNWLVYTPGAGESITQVGNKVTAVLRLSITAEGTDHHICFAAMRNTVNVNITCSYSEGAHTFSNAMVTSTNVDPYPINWTDYSNGVHVIYHKSNISYTISSMDGSDHLNLQIVTVDGVPVTPIDNGDGTYTLELSDISEDMNISIGFRPTVKVTTIIVMDTEDPEHPYDGSYTSKATAVIAGIENYQFTGRTVEIDTQTGTTVYKEYGYLDRNGKVQFTMADYVVTYDATTGEISEITLGIRNIVVTVGGSQSIIANGIPDIYTTDIFSDDAVITITLTSVEKEVVFISDTTTYTRYYKAGTYITLPDKEILSTVISDSGDPMYVSRGYDLLYWKYSGMNINAGSTMQVTDRLVFTAEWAETPHNYNIVYNLDGGSFTETPDYTFTVESDSFMIKQPTRAGYDFAGWSGTYIVDVESEVWIEHGSIDDRYYTAIWTPNDYRVIYDPNGMSVIVKDPRNYTFGDRYEDDKYGPLPIYPNQIGQDGLTYSFAGWALDSSGTNRITADTRVATASEHRIYIIWILSGESLYAINLINSEGGSSVLSSISEQEDADITLTLRPDLGFRPTDVMINIGDGYKSVSELHTLYPAYFDEFSVPLDWEEGDSVDYTFKVKSNTTHMYYVKPVFDTISYTIRITQIQEGVEETIVFGTYNVKSEPVYITSSTVGTYANHTFAGWTGTGIEGMETSYIMIPTGSRGDRDYREVWYATAYAITYVLNEATANSPYNHATYRTGDAVHLYEPVYPSGYDFIGWCTDSALTVVITEIPASSTGDLTLYAKLEAVTSVPKPTSIGTVVYNGLLQTGVVQGVGYSLSGNWNAKYAGTYTVTVMLDNAYVWEGETGDEKYADLELTWTISKRDVYIMSGSGWKIYDGLAMVIPEDGYFTMGITAADIDRFTITTAGTSVTNVGRYINIINVSSNIIDPEEKAAMMGSYTFHVYPGVYVIFNCESSTVTLDYEGTAVGSAQSLGMQITGAISNAQTSNIAAIMPRTRRQL